MMEPPIAALLGTVVGGLAGLAGPLLGGSLQAARDKAKWRLDNQRDAYFNVLQHLSAALSAHSKEDSAQLAAELTSAQAALGTILIFCGESQRERLGKTFESLQPGLGGDQRAATAITELYEAIVSCARRDFHH